MPVLISILPLGVFALLRFVHAGLPVTIAGLQVAVLVAYGLLMTAGARSRAAAVGQRLIAVVPAAIWRVVDVTIIDGTVNGVGLVVLGWSALLRRAQSGSVRVYALSMLAGIVAMLGYFLWR